ncbi:unnamed protein product (macronuclear) [Paramecium tetraurelia]|uniref:Uncharacterized protein n=1 Tax=Paramecium tetraurelia TaxID=5888 RepID=A0CP80_PARTE|nr:uncharacterized protein GSPATT00008988001 [Paramecium tetraurelia]CAK72597.1 unnamed protein product [Paramecium tetraurelia]|eukprot:XP_001439994.1 hypothetical protein (macronuclear) [Paramecium tetraurelia strain d4-2]
MRAFIKTSYFNQPKQTKHSKKPDPQKVKIGLEKLNNYYLKSLASAYQPLMINMIEQMKREFQIIELFKFSNKINQRNLKDIFLAWKIQSQQPQPYKLQLPYSPPKKDLNRKSVSKKLARSKTPRNEVKFVTPGRESSKSVLSTITKDDDLHSNKIADNFRLRKYWNKFKLFANFQKHLAFKSKHFRSFCIIRKYFYRLKAILYLRKLRLQEYQKSKNIYILRFSFSKWHEYGQKKKRYQFIQEKLDQIQKLLLMRKGLKGLHQHAKQKQQLQSTQISHNSQIQSQQQKKIKLIPKKN